MSFLRKLRRKDKPKKDLRHVQVKTTKKIITAGTVCEACGIHDAIIEMVPHINGQQVGKGRSMCHGCAVQTAEAVTAKKMTARTVAQSQKQPQLGFCVGGPGCGKPQGSVKATQLFHDPDGKGPPVPLCDACWQYMQKALRKLDEQVAGM